MNTWSRQGRRFGLITSIILVFMLSACGSSGPSTTTTTVNGTTTTTTQLKIMVGGLSKQIYLPNELTQRLGYFKQEGLDVTLIDEASGQSSENEVLAGQVHFVPVGAGDTFIAALKQGRIDAGMTTEPTISRVLSTGVGKVLVDLRSPQ